MGQGNLQLLYMMATMLIVHELSLTTSSSLSSYYVMAVVVDDTTPSSSSVSSSGSLSMKGTEMDVKSFTHINNTSVMDGMVNRLPRHTFQGLQQQEQLHQQEIENPSSIANTKIKKSISTGGDWTSTTFNGLSGLLGSQYHNIKDSSSGNNYDAQHQQKQQLQLHQQYTEAKPIYEEQQENDYAGGGDESSYNQHSTSTGVGNAAAIHSAIYNLQTAGTHNAAVSTYSGSSTNNGGSDDFLPSWNFGKFSASFIAPETISIPYATSSTSNNNDKTFKGNFLHHYDSASSSNEYTPQHEYQPMQNLQYQLHQQQQQQQQQHENFYNSVEHAEADTFTSSSYNSEHEHENSNYLPSAPSSVSSLHEYEQQHYQQHQQEKQPDVINYVPYPVVKKQHVPVRENVQIPISHTVIIPVRKPVPIHVPVTQNVQVPIEKELKIPVERVVPYPIEKHVPVPVEKRVPYPVVKYMPIKVSRPFPVKVPVFKTVLHKVKGWW